MAFGKLVLSEIKKPVFTIELPDQTREYDPLEVLEKIEAGAKDMKMTSALYDAVRAALDLPDLKRHECLEAFAAIQNFVQELDVTKKLSALTQNSANSASSPAK